MKNRRDLFIIAGLFLALILFVALGPKRRDEPSGPGAPTTYSSEEEGTLALYTWTRALGFDSRRLAYRPFELEEADAALVIFNPSDPITRDQAGTILDWVERGGTLILADDSPIVFGGSNALFDALQIERAVHGETIAWAASGQPALDQPPAGRALVHTERVLIPQRDDYVKILGLPEATVMVGIKHGRGYIYAGTALHPFTNVGLREGENAALALNLLRRVPSGGRIQFDEYHHGFFTPPAAGSAVLSTPWGWAAAYAVIAIALYLILSGRRFGRPVPLREEIARRSSAEYVESMADLFQRGGKRGYILRHYHAAFKRRLARPYGVNPQLDDQEFARELARFREIDEPALLALLARLRDEQASEDAMVRAVADADSMLAALISGQARA